MLHNWRPSGSARLGLWLCGPLLLAFVLVTMTAGVPSRAADPPADRVDDFRAAFQKDIDTLIWPRAHELPELVKKAKDLEGDPDKKEDLAEARRNLDTAKNELTQALDQRDKDLPQRIKVELAKADTVDRVALANLLGDEAQRIPFPDNDKLFAIVPNYLEKLHPEIPFLIELTEPSNPVEVRLAATLALGKTKGDPAIVVPALAKVLRNQRNPVALRVAAAEALAKPIPYLQASQPLPQPGKTGIRTDTSNTERLKLILQDTSARAWPALIDGINDPSPAVRVAAAKSAKDISGALLDGARVAAPRDFLQEYANLLKAFRDEMPKLVTALEDKDPALRLLALGVLEDVATTRMLLATNVPPEQAPAPKPMTRADRPRPPKSLPDELPVTLPAPRAPSPLALSPAGERGRGEGAAPPAPAAQPTDGSSVLPSALKAAPPPSSWKRPATTRRPTSRTSPAALPTPTVSSAGP